MRGATSSLYVSIQANTNNNIAQTTTVLLTEVGILIGKETLSISHSQTQDYRNKLAQALTSNFPDLEEVVKQDDKALESIAGRNS